MRDVAYKILKEIIIKDAYPNLVLKKELENIEFKEKKDITRIVYGTLRNYIFLKYQIDLYLKKKTNEEVYVLLALSLYQMFYMDSIPSYAIVDEANKLADHRYKKLVNAILRNIKELKEIKEDSLENISIKYSMPLWIIKLWISHYGKDTALDLVRDSINEPIIYGRLNTIKISKEKLIEDKDVEFLNDISFTYKRNILNTSYFKNGEIIIQDINSAKIPLFLDLKENLKVLDSCGAPGSKSSEISMLMNNSGEVVAVDINENRLKLIDDLAIKLGLKNIKTLAYDSRFIDEKYKDYFDRILVDAPCLGLGVLKGKPDIKLKLQPKDLDEIIDIQKDILNSSAKCLKSGGILVYSTCSLNKKENENQVDRFLKENKDFKLIEEHTYFTHLSNGDGFFVAKLERE